MIDARRYEARDGLFDRVLVDAPCSSEGRFRSDDPVTYAYWSERKIREMVRKQRGLLWRAVRLVKPGGTVVYSTCTFAPEENEGVLDWVLRKAGDAVSVEPLAFPGVATCPALCAFAKKSYNPLIHNAIRILPAHHMTAFFIAKLTRHPNAPASCNLKGYPATAGNL